MMTAGACLKNGPLENTRSLKVASRNDDGTTQMHGCKCSFEKQYALNRNIYQIHRIYAVYGCNGSSKKYGMY